MKEVKTPKKPLLFYYAVALLVLFLFNLLAMPWLPEHQIHEVDYNTFVSMTEKKEIGQVEIQQQDNRILFTSTDGKTIYKTAMVLFVVYEVYRSEEAEGIFSAVASGVFILPFFVLSALAGQLADMRDKAKIIRIVKAAEIAAHKPAFAVERFFGRLLVVEIPEHQTGTAPTDLADLARRHLPVGVLLVPQSDFVGAAGPGAGRDDRFRIV